MSGNSYRHGKTYCKWCGEYRYYLAERCKECNRRLRTKRHNNYGIITEHKRY